MGRGKKQREKLRSQAFDDAHTPESDGAPEVAEQLQAIRGNGNPQRMSMPLWEDLVRTGETAYSAAKGRDLEVVNPGWSFYRFGTTRTRMPDGRIICVAGEHEDYYDPDFFIYNDVVVLHPDGKVEIFGYSADVFPPTDFHTATLVGNEIWIIGCIGYAGHRGDPATPVFAVDTKTYAIRRLLTSGDGPGWLNSHRAELTEDRSAIRVAGGTVISRGLDGEQVSTPNLRTFSLNVNALAWSVTDGPVPAMAGEVFEWPEQLVAFNDADEAEKMRQALMQGAQLDDPLFTGDFWPIGESTGCPRAVYSRMTDGSGRWARCEGPSYVGRFDPGEHAVRFFRDWIEVLESIRADGA